MKIRVIHSVLNDLEEEDVIFTEEFDSPVNDFLRPGFKVVSDSVRDLDLPDSFPTESTLTKRF